MIKYPDFRAAYGGLKRHTATFTNFTETAVGEALREHSRVLGILPAILGIPPPEWAELASIARREGLSDITQGAAQQLPGWSQIDTPVGTNNPDWAILKHVG